MSKLAPTPSDNLVEPQTSTLLQPTVPVGVGDGGGGVGYSRPSTIWVTLPPTRDDRRHLGYRHLYYKPFHGR